MMRLAASIRTAAITQLLNNTHGLAQSVPTALLNYWDEWLAPASGHTDELLGIMMPCTSMRHLLISTLDLVDTSQVQLARLTECMALAGLTTLALGTRTKLLPGPFFQLLAQLPALKKLQLSSRAVVEVRTNSEPTDFARPACSLTHLFIHCEWGLAPEHYHLLLSRSTGTLAHLELRDIFCDRTCVAEMGLALCARLRHVALVGNDISVADVLAAVPPIQRLSLHPLPAPGHHLQAVLKLPLRALELENTYREYEPFVAASCARLLRVLPCVPSLGSIRFVLDNYDVNFVAAEPEAFVALRNACKERRIALSVAQRVWGLHPHGAFPFFFES